MKMPVSDKLAYEIYTIIIFHIVALLFLSGFSFTVYLRAKKTPLLYSYLAVVAMIMLWMVSKVLKTVSPTEGLRWFFIVTQYFGVELLGYCLVVFAYTYTRDKLPTRKSLILWAVIPVVSFVIVLTNPLHMAFYSYYDFYKDRFGPLFYPIQTIQYTYMIMGIVMLSKGYTNQPGFNGKRGWARLFAAVTLLPLISNIYYILFKMDFLPWVLPFMVFDFTPVAGSLALVMFMIPVLKYRFFDISPVSYGKLYEQMSLGIVFVDAKGVMYAGNRTFVRMFGEAFEERSLGEFAETLYFKGDRDRQEFIDFIKDASSPKDFEILLGNDLVYKVTKKQLNKRKLLLSFMDISLLAAYRYGLSTQNAELVQVNRKLDALARNMRELAIAQTKARIAQNMHDILGHSLTVVIGTAELAAGDQDRTEADQKLSQIGELLTSCLNDLRNSFIEKESDWGQTSLTKAVAKLKNQNIQVDFVIQGTSYELNSSQTEAVFRLYQEAVTNAIKHGKAKTIHMILRYKQQEVEVFAIDDGAGCSNIVKSFGLMGIETRFNSLGGSVNFGSNGERGFAIHALLPRNKAEAYPI